MADSSAVLQAFPDSAQQHLEKVWQLVHSSINTHTFALPWGFMYKYQGKKNAFSFLNSTFVFLPVAGCFNNGELGEEKELTLVLFLSAFSSAISSSLSSSCSLHTFSSFVSAANSWNKPDRNISTSNIRTQ